MKKKIVIIGGVAGGASAAARLRRLDEQSEIILFERGPHVSFANCGLPYYTGGKIADRDKLELLTPEDFYDHFFVDVRVREEVLSVNRGGGTVTVKSHNTGKTYTENFDILVLAPGAEPIQPNIEGINLNGVFSLRTIPDAMKIREYIDNTRPASAAVAGGGATGIEMAENLLDAGIKVTIVETLDQLISPIDYEMACIVHRYLESRGVKLILKNRVESIAENDGALKISLTDGAIQTDMLIMAVGVRPESDLARAAALELNERGGIVVGPDMCTSDPRIYAVGAAVETNDFVTSRRLSAALAGPANKQGRIAAGSICGLGENYRGIQGSAILKIFDMAAASTGINEKTAKKLSLDYDKSYTFSPSHAEYYPGAREMAVKIIYGKKDGKLLGAQIVGFEGVDKRCDVFATAIHGRMTVSDLGELELCYAPPFSSAKDPVNVAGFTAENALRGRVRNFHWHDVRNLPRDGSVQLVDVRDAREYAGGNINGFINIPLDNIRDSITELNKNKPVYICCRTGMRGYIASRILAQYGFEVYNLSGGCLLYNTVYPAPAAASAEIFPCRKPGTAQLHAMSRERPAHASRY
ncbi:MAG: FAD-dependent oxidoreductase [Spirochaetaceae bacterium]|jgi:NADPH-dependent 2,4-dienoyl-CoA reductase/sulfur reductase-like enzyme/rhodanese-related sulfurtransferase|nr:FAD-dependent oxidoreductase [Spirochaetaceae bacterium]